MPVLSDSLIKISNVLGLMNKCLHYRDIIIHDQLHVHTCTNNVKSKDDPPCIARLVSGQRSLLDFVTEGDQCFTNTSF